MSGDSLEKLRGRISALNRKLLDEVNERLRLVAEIRALKVERGLAMHDPVREEQMLRELVAANPGPLTEAQLREVFEAIFSVSLEFLERPTPLPIPPASPKD